MYLMFFLYTFSTLNPSTKCLEYRCKVKKKYLIIFKINYKQKNQYICIIYSVSRLGIMVPKFWKL